MDESVTNREGSPGAVEVFLHFLAPGPKWLPQHPVEDDTDSCQIAFIRC